jgi:hypothetical protein
MFPVREVNMLRTTEIIKHAKETLKDPTAEPAEKLRAKAALKRKPKTPALKRPRPGDFPDEKAHRDALAIYWNELDQNSIRQCAIKVLNNRDASPLERRNARAKLESIDGKPSQEPAADDPETKIDRDSPTREDFGFRSGADWDEFVVSGKEAEFQSALTKWCETAPPPKLDPKAEEFLNNI